MEFSTLTHVHFVGIKGVGMTALALYMKDRGVAVTGSDVIDIFPTDAMLYAAGIVPRVGFDEAHIVPSIDLVVYTGAHKGSNNPEVVIAKKHAISVMSHAEALGFVMKEHTGIAVSGSHGKTTTSAMLATVLTLGGFDPSYAIGCGSISPIGPPGHFGRGEYFVAEADEYMTDPGIDTKPRFLWQHPKHVIITNIEFDHPDAFASVDAVRDAFEQFTKQVAVDGYIVAGADSPQVVHLIKSLDRNVISYGKKNSGADVWYEKGVIENGKNTFSVFQKDTKIGQFELAVPGEHNISNATGIVALAKAIGIETEIIARGLAAFSGSKRRFEYRGARLGVSFYDDYAHHPTEIKSTLESAREWFGDRKITVIFQPHTYSRTRRLLDSFAASFSAADQVVITDIYPSARELPDPDMNGQTLVDAILMNQENVIYAPGKSDVLEYIEHHTDKNSVILTMGAGDIYTWIPPDVQKN